MRRLPRLPSATLIFYSFFFPYSYKSLTNGYLELPDEDDAEQFLETNEAFKIMGMTDAEIKDVWKIVAAVLAFGQLEWIGGRAGDQCNIKSDAPAQHVRPCSRPANQSHPSTNQPIHI